MAGLHATQPTGGGFQYGTAFVSRRARSDRGDGTGGVRRRGGGKEVGPAPLDDPARAGPGRRPAAVPGRRGAAVGRCRGGPAQGLQAGGRRGTGLGRPRAPRPAVVAAFDLSGFARPGALGVRGDHLPGLLRQLGQRRPGAGILGEAAPTTPAQEAPKPLGAGQALGVGRIPAHSRPARRSRRQIRAGPLGGRPGHRPRQPERGGHAGGAHQPRHTLVVPLGGYDAPSTAEAVTLALARQPG